MSKKKYSPAKGMNIIKHLGTPVSTEFMGVTIMREDKLFVEEWETFVTCAPYDDHFVFEVPRVKIGRAKEFLSSLRSQKATDEKTKHFITMLMGAIQVVDENKTVQLPGPAHMCTCGSAALGVNPTNPYVAFNPTSPDALMICHLEFTTGLHQTSHLNKKDFDKVAAQGQTLKPKGKKWLI